MNELLDFTGALIYLLLSIVLFPLFMLVQLVLRMATGLNHAMASYHRFKKREKKRRQGRPAPFFELISESKWFNWKTR